MDNKSFRYFDAVARRLSFTKAAEELHIAQPAVSMAIKKLEQSFELQLFHRQDRQITLTDEGKVFWRHCKKVLSAIADTEQEMAELKGLSKGEVRIGIPSMLGSYFFPSILISFRDHYPHINLSVTELGTWEIQQMLSAGDLDLGIIVDDTTPNTLAYQQFLTAEMRVTVPSNHPYAQLTSITPEQLFNQPLVMFKEGYFHRKVVDELAAQAGRTPNIVFETNLIPLIKEVVKQGKAITSLLEMVITDDTELIGIPFTEPVWLNLAIAWRKDGYLSHANKAFLDFLLTHNATAIAPTTCSPAP